MKIKKIVESKEGEVKNGAWRGCRYGGCMLTKNVCSGR